MQTRRLRVALSALALTASFLTGAGLFLSAALKNNKTADFILSHYPRYSLAMKGFNALQDFKYPTAPPDPPLNVGLVSIDDKEWGVLLDFIQSEVAIRKSERNEPSPLHSAAAPANPPTPSPTPSNTDLPNINFDRIKTIISMRMDVASVGAKPLAPPYRLIVFWPNPPSTPRRVYEFLSFAEFRLDLRHFILDEIEEWSLWMAVIAFAVSVPAEALRRIIATAEERKTVDKLTAARVAETTIV